MFGHCYLVHIGPLAAALKRIRPLTRIAACETVLPPSPTQALEWRSMARAYAIDDFTMPPTVSNAGASFFDRVKRRAAVLMATSDTCSQFPRDLCDYDLFHLHWPSLHSASMLRRVPAKKPVVLSFWGHDVLDGSCEDTHRFQRRAINRADIVTVRSIDLREHLYSKFGRACSSKIRIAKFANDMFRERDALDMSRLRAAFRGRHDIAQDAIVITLGHCGHPKENHVSVLESLHSLGTETTDVVLMIPMTYGGTQDYRERVRRAAQSMGLRVLILENFTDREGVWETRAATDVFISVPDEDSFSAAMCESILAGAVAIVGDWLPYGALRRLGVHYRSVETITDVKDAILTVLSRITEEKKAVTDTAGRLRGEIDIDTAVGGWWRAYDDALLAADDRCRFTTSLPR